MGRPYTGKKCVSRIKVPQKNGDIYVYERTTSYDRKLKKTVIEGKKLIGKILAGSDEIVPTRAKKPSKKKQSVNKNSASVVTNLPGDAGVANEAGHLNEEASTAGASASPNTPPSAAKPPVVAAVRHRIGAVEILKWAGAESGITEALKKNFDIGDAQKINTIAYYWLCTDGQSLPRLEGWQVTHPTPYAEGVSENICGRLFVTLSQNEDGIQGYFKEMAKAIGDRPILALDTSTVDTYSQNQYEARFGFSKESDDLPSIKLLTFMEITGHHPFAFDQQPGNIPDVISIKQSITRVRCLTEGKQKPLIVADSGFCSEENLLLFVRNSMPFLTRISTGTAWVREHLDEIKGSILDIKNACPFDSATYGITVPVKHTFNIVRERTRGEYKAGETQPLTRTLYLHFFYCDTKAVEERKAFNKELQELHELANKKVELSASARRKVKKYFHTNEKGEVEYNNAAISEERLRFGYFVLISNSEKDTFTTLKYYRWRARIEDLFSVQKKSTDGRRPRVWYPDSLRGRQFVQFVALGHYFFLQTKIDALIETLGVEEPGKTKAEVAAELRLKSWLEQRSLTQILEWFDAVSQTTVMTPYGRRRITTESTARDQLFLKKLGVIK